MFNLHPNIFRKNIYTITLNEIFDYLGIKYKYKTILYRGYYITTNMTDSISMVSRPETCKHFIGSTVYLKLEDYGIGDLWIDLINKYVKVTQSIQSLDIGCRNFVIKKRLEGIHYPLESSAKILIQKHIHSILGIRSTLKHVSIPLKDVHRFRNKYLKETSIIADFDTKNSF